MKDLNCLKDKKISESFFKRFNKYVVKSENENDCWKWNGAKSTNGYPVMSLGRELGVFRVSRLLLNYFTIMPTDTSNVLHTCDNPECTNTNHLFWGSQKENIHDCINKKRNYIPKPLTRDFTSRSNIKTIDIPIIEKLAMTKNAKEISEIYLVNEETVRRLLKKENIKCPDKRLSKNKNL